MSISPVLYHPPQAGQELLSRHVYLPAWVHVDKDGNVWVTDGQDVPVRRGAAEVAGGRRVPKEAESRPGLCRSRLAPRWQPVIARLIWQC